MWPAFIDIGNPPIVLPDKESHVSCLSRQCSPNEAAFSVSLIEDALSNLPTILDVPQRNFGDQIAPSDTLYPSTEVPKSSSRQLFEDHASTDVNQSHDPADPLESHEHPIQPYKSQECEPGIAAADVGLPSSMCPPALSQGESEQQGTCDRFGISNKVVSSGRESAAEVSLTTFPNTTVSLPYTNLTYKLTAPLRREYAASHHFAKLRI